MPTLLVTGARQGLGLEVVRQYVADSDWNVIAACLNPAPRTTFMRLPARHQTVLRFMGSMWRTMVPSISLPASCEVGRLTWLLNNAGVKGPDEQTFGAYDYESGWTCFGSTSWAR